MVKLIIFDLSGVLFNNEEREYLNGFAERHKLSFEEVRTYYKKLIEMAEKDEVTAEYAWAKIFKRFDVNQDIAATIRDVIKMKKADNSMLEFVKELRKKYKTAYLTNYARAYWEPIKKAFPFSDYFDYGAASCDIGARKSSRKGFERIMFYFEIKPEECIFVDDKEENLAEAKSMGIKAVHFKERESFLEEMKNIL